MNIERFLSELVRDEGEILYAYPDSLGYTTIGVGRLIDRRRGGGITQQESRFLLRNDVERVMAELDVRLPWWRELDDVRQRVIANMAFNLGVSGLLKWRNTLAAVRNGEYGVAADMMLASKWASQVGARAFRLAEAMRKGVVS